MSRQLLINLASPDSAYRFFFPGIDFIVAFICEAYLLVEICLDELESFPAGLEEDIIEFWDRRARAQRIEQLPRSDRPHINHRGEYFPIYHEEG